MNLNRMLRVFALAFALVAVVLVFSGVSHADDCDLSTREILPECATKRYGSSNLSVTVVNQCANRIKVKIDRTGLFCGDWTWTLDGEGGTAQQSGYCEIKNVMCCAHSSVGGCSQTWENLCRGKWNSSSASGSCANATFGYDESTQSCEITAYCLNHNNKPTSVSTTQNVGDVKDLHNCSGKLTLQSC